MSDFDAARARHERWLDSLSNGTYAASHLTDLHEDVGALLAEIRAARALADELAKRLLAHRYQSVGPITGGQWVQHGHDAGHRKAENCLTCDALAKWEASK